MTKDKPETEQEIAKAIIDNALRMAKDKPLSEKEEDMSNYTFTKLGFATEDVKKAVDGMNEWFDKRFHNNNSVDEDLMKSKQEFNKRFGEFNTKEARDET